MTNVDGTYSAPDGNKIAYKVWGSEHSGSTPLVLITGLSALMEDWCPLVDLLAKKRKVLTIEHRGMGTSALPTDWDEDHSLELEARDTLAVLKHLGSDFQRVNLLGWSMGGHITQVLITLPEAKEHADGGLVVLGIHVEKVILAATMTKLPRAEFTPQILEETLTKVAGDPDRKLKITRVMMEYQYDPKWLAASEENKRLFEHRVDRSATTRRPQKMIALQAASIAQVDTRKSLQNLPSSLPVLVIHGKLDRMVSYAESDHIVKNIKHAQRFDPGSKGDQYGHFWFDYFDTQWWADEIEKYLGVSRGSAKL